MKAWILVFLLLLWRAAFGQDCASNDPQVQQITECEPPIFTLFSQHGNPQLLGHIDEAIINSEKQGPQQTINSIRRIIHLEDAAQNIRNLKKVRVQLEAFVTKERVDWIGLEFTPQELREEDGLGDLMSEIQRVREFFIPLTIRSAKIPNPLSKSEIEDLLYIIVPTISLVAEKNPKSLERVRVVPLERDEEKSKDWNFHNEKLSKIYPALRNMLLKHQINEQAFQDFLTIKVRVACTGIKVSDKEINNFIQNIMPVSSKKTELDSSVPNKIREFFQIVNDGIPYRLARNHVAAENAVKQTGSGLILMGTRHHQVGDELKQICQSKKNQPISRPESFK